MYYNNGGGGGGGVGDYNIGGGDQLYVDNNDYSQQQQQQESEFDRTEEEIDEEMQRELAEDAPWKKIQQNTFTRWANEHLKLCNRRIEDLQYDLSDGLNLIALIEVLSHKKLPRHNKKVMFRSQKLENVSVVLDFLENVEHIRLVNIDSTHVVDGKLKLILGLIWTLILHYSITMPMWDNEDDPGYGRGGSQPTPKQKLMSWIQSKLPPDVQINNFTTDWNDGRAIGALVDSCAPGLYPDWATNNPRDHLKNAKEAMDLAEQWLGIPQLIRPEEMINPKVDELSMMTYLSQYPSAKLRAGAPIKQRTNVGRVRCFGKGIEPTGNNVDAPAKFFIETVNAGVGDPEVIIINPRGQKEPSQIEFNNDKNATYTVTYTPTMEGNYKVIVKYGGQEVPKSPYNVYIEGKVGDPSKVFASGPGIEPNGVVVDKPTWFEIDVANAGNGQVEVAILDPTDSHQQIPVQLKPISKTKYRCEYVAKQPGLHSVNVFFAGQPVPESPFGVKVAPSCDAKKCRAFGRGIQPKGVRVGDVADFRVITKDAGEGILKATVIGPDGYELPVRCNKVNATTYECGYNPTRVGPHQVHITYGGIHIPKSPYNVDVGQYKESLIRAYGPGLEGGIVGYPADFVVDTNGETGSLGFSIEGPSQAKIDCVDNFDGSANVRYWPTASGEYAIHILCDNEDIPNSPYMAWIEQRGNFDPTKCKAYGPGIDAEIPLVILKPTEFTVDCREAGDAPIRVTCTDADFQKIDVSVKNNGNGTYTCRYTPIYPTKHTIFVTYGGVAIPKCPYKVTAIEPSNPSKVKIYGPGVEKGVKTNQPTHFTVDCTGAGPGDVNISILNPKNVDLRYDIDQKGDEIFEVKYQPKLAGPHIISVTFNDQEVPQSPIKVLIEPDVDVTRIKITGFEPNPQVGEPSSFNIITSNALSPGSKLNPNDVKVTIESLNASPRPQQFDAFIEPSKDGFVTRYTLSEPGPYNVHVEVCDVPIKDLRLDAVEPINPNKVKAYGPGLTHGSVDKPADFVIDTRGAGNGALNLTVEGPCEACIECKDNQDGTCHVSYLPTMPGTYMINILYDGVHIPNSPFEAVIESDLDVSKIRVYGPGVDPKGNFIQSPTEFTVDARGVTNTGQGKVQCELQCPSGKRHLCPVLNNGDGTYTVQYVPDEIGHYVVDVSFEGKQVPGSPFKTQGIAGCDPSRVRVYGPGLEGGITNEPCMFTVETKGCGQGSLSLAIEGPSEAKMICKENQSGTCIMEYLPLKAGPYDISIKYADRDVPGSPFRVNIEDKVDASKVQLHMPKKPLRANIPSEFIVDGRDAGKADLNVELHDIHGRARPVHVVSLNDGQYKATVTPTSEGPHRIDCEWNGQPILNTPLNVNVLPTFEAKKVRVDGAGIRNGIAASLATSFVVDTRDAGVANLDVNIKDPEGNFVHPRIEDNHDGTYVVHYTPEDVGRYTINVLYGGQPVNNSPFNVKVDPIGDANKCQVYGTGLEPVVQVGEDYTITVDTRDAGQGNVTCHIRSANGNDLDIDIEDNNDGTFNIYYTPHNPGSYMIKIKFGGQDIPNGDVTVTAGDEPYITQNTRSNYYPIRGGNNSAIQQSKVESSYSRTVQSGYDSFEPVNLRIPIEEIGTVFNNKTIVSARVKMPSGKIANPVVEQNADGTVSIKYQPTEIGLHELDVFYNGQSIQGSPFRFHVDAVTSSNIDLLSYMTTSASSGYVTAYGPGLSHGICGEPCEFRIVTKDAGHGGLAVAVEGPSKAEIQCRDNKNGTCDVVYYPVAPGDYTITVKFADKHIVGSPFTAKIVNDLNKRSYLQYGTQSDISLKVIEGDVHNLQATIRSPSGHEEPCLLKKLSNGSLGISFTPREVGEHLVSVLRDGKHIKNSPFNIEVRQSEIGDANKVRVYGKGLIEGVANHNNEFIVNTKDAGYGGLSLSIEGPSKADIECHDNDDGSCRVTYKPTEVGSYVINIKFADKHVPGSPFTVNVNDPLLTSTAHLQSNRLIERVIRERKACEITQVGSQCELSLKIPNTNALDLTAYVKSPSGQIEDCEIVDLDDYNYCIRFVPKEMGTHTVSIKHRDMHIPGSPFEFTVGKISGGGSHKVRATGQGLVKGEINQSCDFNIYTREAGAGALSIAVEGPAKAEIDFHDRKDGTCGVSYVCSEPGDYEISVKFNDEHIPDSPFHAYISPPIGDAKRLTINSLRTKGLEINKPFSFELQLNGARGKLDARVISPSNIEDYCVIQDMGDDNYSIRFIPHENGVHWIHVYFNNIEISESPFRVSVGQINSDPGRVYASGNGLYQGETGKVCEFQINTVNAGAGALAITVDGPAKVELDCKEVQDGYKVKFVPSAPGDYLITVKFVGVNIAGSPFKCHVIDSNASQARLVSIPRREHSNIVFETVEKNSTTTHLQQSSVQHSMASDATKVRVKGSGIYKAYRNQRAQFTVDTSNAGSNMLMVGVYGPKQPCEEVVVKHVGNQQYQVTYCVKDKGEYVLIVKYGDTHIPGSPFHIEVV